MALGCVILIPARTCRFTAYKNVHNTTLSTKIALYTYEKLMQINVCYMVNTDHYYELVFDKMICIEI